jgi:hypothetical protein
MLFIKLKTVQYKKRSAQKKPWRAPFDKTSEENPGHFTGFQSGKPVFRGAVREN